MCYSVIYLRLLHNYLLCPCFFKSRLIKSIKYPGFIAYHNYLDYFSTRKVCFCIYKNALHQPS